METLNQDKLIEYKQRVAFHEAGHAAGIHLNNKARQLPPVFFKIIFKDMGGITVTEGMAYQSTHDECVARVEGGRLIELLPLSFDSLMRGLTERNNATVQPTNDYLEVFEADIINLLIGPLAEAKHVADTDDELFNHKLVNLNALTHYGGSSDLALANDYLQSYSADEQQKDNKLNELFLAAFDFINDNANWAAITKLADYILSSNKNTIFCNEIISTLDQSINQFQNRRIEARYHHYFCFEEQHS
jgi:hypothetical protein